MDDCLEDLDSGEEEIPEDPSFPLPRSEEVCPDGDPTIQSAGVCVCACVYNNKSKHKLYDIHTDTVQEDQDSGPSTGRRRRGRRRGSRGRRRGSSGKYIRLYGNKMVYTRDYMGMNTWERDYMGIKW